MEANFSIYIDEKDQTLNYIFFHKNEITYKLGILFNIFLQTISKKVKQDIILRITKKEKSIKYFENDEDTFFYCAKNDKMIVNNRLFFETDYIDPQSELFFLKFGFLNNFRNGPSVNVNINFNEENGEILLMVNNKKIEYNSNKFLCMLIDTIGKYLIVSIEKSGFEGIFVRTPLSLNHKGICITTIGRYSDQTEMLNFLSKEFEPHELESLKASSENFSKM